MNILGIGGLILLIFGILIFINVGWLQFLVGLVFVLGGAYLAAKGFGLPVP